jgi:hypothetical protein
VEREEAGYGRDVLLKRIVYAYAIIGDVEAAVDVAREIEGTSNDVRRSALRREGCEMWEVSRIRSFAGQLIETAVTREG